MILLVIYLLNTSPSAHSNPEQPEFDYLKNSNQKQLTQSDFISKTIQNYQNPNFWRKEFQGHGNQYNGNNYAESWKNSWNSPISPSDSSSFPSSDSSSYSPSDSSSFPSSLSSMDSSMLPSSDSSRPSSSDSSMLPSMFPSRPPSAPMSPSPKKAVNDGSSENWSRWIQDDIQDFINDRFRPQHQKNTNVELIVGLAIGIPLLIAAICFLGYCIYRQKRRSSDTKKILESPSSSNSNTYNLHEIHGKQSPLIMCTDPWAMDRTQIVVEYGQKLGSGAFCNVHKGHIKGSAAVRKIFPDLISVQKFIDCDIAVKLLPSFADDIARSDFNQEISFMKSLNYHPHLVCMLGYVPDPRNPLLLVEYCANGDLLHLIRNHRKEIEHVGDTGYENSQGLKIKNLVVFAWQISNGLEYINSIGCIHRDVAARNVLVDGEYSCKIGDFGLCRLTDNLLYTARGGRLPLRWMAIESLKSFEYSFKSDVWAYGILLWELLSLGEVPYNNIDNQQLLEYLESGQRLQKPIYCPFELYEIMKICWRPDPTLRPSFPEICAYLKRILDAANEDYGYLIPVSTLATVEATDDGSQAEKIRIDDV